jgi:hypothetical protein
MGVRGPLLDEVGGEPLGGQIFNVFTLSNGRIVRIGRPQYTGGRTLAQVLRLARSSFHGVASRRKRHQGGQLQI